jgi:hypothetical protein
VQPTRKAASPDSQSGNFLACRNAEFMKALKSFQILPAAPMLHVDSALAQISGWVGGWEKHQPTERCVTVARKAGQIESSGWKIQQRMTGNQRPSILTFL